MAPYEPLQNIEYPELGNENNPPKYIESVVKDLVQRSNMRFATTAARDAAITAPVNGMECYTAATKTKWIFENGAWVVMRKPLDFVKITKTSPSNAYTGVVRCYLSDDDDVEIVWTCSTTINAGALLDILTDSELPDRFRPKYHSMPVSAHSTGGYGLDGAVTVTGRVYVRNTHTGNSASHQGTARYSVKPDPSV